jgi:type II secretory ATPase GspE/PulE/Tfp pilus assembly ATPase PilB-like protein
MRLIDMGVEPYLVSSTLIGAMAQRLIRKICSHCKRAFEPEPARIPSDFKPVPGEVLWRGQGCEACRNTGYRGRSGLFELMVMTDAIAEKIMKRAPTFEVIQTARAGGMRLLREDGWCKVHTGVTTIDEVLKCTAV